MKDILEPAIAGTVKNRKKRPENEGSLPNNMSYMK
jgi:hypothetical protein